jgi:hypothetical protein
MTTIVSASLLIGDYPTYICRPISSSSFSIGRAGGNPAYRTSAFEAVCVLTPVFSSPVHLQRRSTPDSVRYLY